MGLLTIIRKNQRKAKAIRILMLGLDNAGKTTILRRVSGEDISRISATLGFNIKTLVHRGYSLNIWDVGGQKSLRPYWSNYFGTTDAVIWVVDATDQMRLQDCKQELHSLLVEERLVGASLLILANKQDLKGSLSSEYIEEELGLSEIKTHQWKILPCSATTGENLLIGLDWTVQEVKRRLYYSAVPAAFNLAATPGLSAFDSVEQQQAFAPAQVSRKIQAVLANTHQAMGVPQSTDIPTGSTLRSTPASHSSLEGD